MSDLENNEAKPTISDMMRYGGAVSILPRGIATIASFGFKMAAISNCIESVHKPYFSDSERYGFAKTLKVPDGVQMWLFALNTPGRVIAKFGSHLGRFPANAINRFEMYVGTFALGKFGIQVVASRWCNPHLVAAMGRFPGVAEADQWRDATVQLWPSDGKPIRWPPRFHLTFDHLDEFSTRWLQLRLPKSWDSKS